MTPQPIELKPVTSSQISHVGYHSESQTLAIRFFPRGEQKQGAIYHYLEVPEETASALRNAPSVGKYFGANVLSAFKGVKITE